MAGCDITRGLSATICNNSVAGLKNLYIANYDEYGLEVDGTESEEITTLPVLLDEVFKFPLKNTGNTFQEDSETNMDNGTTIFTQVLNFVINKISGQKQFQVKLLAWGRPIIFVETNAGEVFVMGKENGADVKVSTTVAGEMSGANQYVLEATAIEREPIAFLSSTAITALKALVTPGGEM